MGPSAIGYEAIKAWSELTDQHPNPFEVGSLMALDNIWMSKQG
jgi:hypothetical protein